MEQIFDIVKQITGVMIVFSVLLHIFSGSPYRRYFQFVEGLLILLLVTAPLFRQWKQEDIVEDCFRKYQKQWETREVEEEMKRIGERRENLINQEGRRCKMKETWSDTIKQMVKKAGKGKILLLIAVGVLLLLVSIKDSGRQAATTEKSQNTVTEQSTSDDMQRYREKMETQVKEILEQVEGVGKADVMLTLQASKEKVTLKDNKQDDTKTEEETVLLDGESRESSPYVVQEIEPQIEGIVVVCSGGDSPAMPA